MQNSESCIKTLYLQTQIMIERYENKRLGFLQTFLVS